MNKKNIVSVFDGMSCGQIALKELGFEYDNYFASEIDEFANKITLKNHPNTKHIGDIYKVDGKEIKDVHLFMGGSPCQSFSRSGDGTGFDGKSGLFWEYVRVLRETNPKWFLLENVVMKKEWEDIITKELGVSPIMIDSKSFSAQKRQRLYWTNIPVDEIIDENISIQDIMDIENRIPVDVGGLLWFENGEYRVKNATKKGYLTVENYDVINLDFPKSKTRRGRVSRKKSNTLNTSCNQGIFIDGNVFKLSVLECERLQPIPDNYTFGVSDNQRRKMIGNGWTMKVIKHILKNAI